MKHKRFTLGLLAALLSAGSMAVRADEGHKATAAKAGAAHAHTHAAGDAHGQGDAIGVPGLAAKIDRTIDVDMTDAMRFKPASVAVKQGETVRFVVRNSGQLKHEFVLGTEPELKAHYEAMQKFPEMEHADPNMVTVAPGKSGDVTWQFTKSGKVHFACLQPGHYEAGMKGAVSVAASKDAASKGAGGKAAHGDHKH